MKKKIIKIKNMITANMNGIEVVTEYLRDYEEIIESVSKRVVRDSNKISRAWIKTKAPVVLSSPVVAEVKSGNKYLVSVIVPKAKRGKGWGANSSIYLPLVDPGKGKKFAYKFPPIESTEEMEAMLERNDDILTYPLPIKITLHFVQRYMERFWNKDPSNYTFEEMLFKFLSRNRVYAFPPVLENEGEFTFDSIGSCDDGAILTREDKKMMIRRFNTFLTKEMLFSGQEDAFDNFDIPEKLEEMKNNIFGQNLFPKFPKFR